MIFPTRTTLQSTGINEQLNTLDNYKDVTIIKYQCYIIKRFQIIYILIHMFFIHNTM